MTKRRESGHEEVERKSAQAAQHMMQAIEIFVMNNVSWAEFVQAAEEAWGYVVEAKAGQMPGAQQQSRIIMPGDGGETKH